MLLTEFDIDVAREAWLEEGEQKGMKIGEIKKQIEIAKKLIGVLDVEVIAEKTGLSLEEVKKLL